MTDHLLPVEQPPVKRKGPRPGTGLIDLIGQRFGRLLVAALVGRRNDG